METNNRSSFCTMGFVIFVLTFKCNQFPYNFQFNIMRLLFILVLGIPLFSSAQINRSANELAREKVQEYIVSKVFKDMLYKPVSYGELKPQKQDHSEIIWFISHQFEITDSQYVADKKIAVRKPYFFSFYLDKKLKVLAAQRYFQE